MELKKSFEFDKMIVIKSLSARSTQYCYRLGLIWCSSTDESDKETGFFCLIKLHKFRLRLRLKIYSGQKMEIKKKIFGWIGR